MQKFNLSFPTVKNRYYFIVDVFMFLIITTFALIIRLDGDIASAGTYAWSVCFATFLFTVIKLTVLICFGIYSRFWQYAGARDFMDLALAIFLSTIIEGIILAILYTLVGNSFSVISNLPRSLFLLDALLSLVAILGFRYGMREFLQHQRMRNARDKSEVPQINTKVLIIGAGNAGTSLVRQMQSSPEYGLLPIAFIDDNPHKLNQKILGINVVGSRSKITHVIQSMRIDKVIIAIPSATGKNIREIVNICKQKGVSVITLPSLNEIVSSDRGIEVNTLRNIEIEDLLRRQPIKTDLHKVSELVRGKRILVTGAGGSIGSEICRQILNFQPSEIMLLGKGENSIFLVHQELEKVIQTMGIDRQIPKLHSYICDIRLYSRLKYVFENFCPEIVFHAAAHKHVPLMELNPPEAITTNIFGTKNLAELANIYNVENFVMISTDKAVNPTNVMGASKRVAEMVVLQVAKKYKKPFTVVRFGNVLGSRGSVVPTFKRQIAEGGPVTITHPDIIRYFMTIPEAVQLVLQTSVLGQGGEVCMLDMGEPVKILDLAKDLIHLSGYEVDKDIEIIYTGLRPGEKLFEELFIPGEKYESTEHEKIRVVWNASDRLPQHLDLTIKKLGEAAERNDYLAISELLKTLVLGYVPTLQPKQEPINVIANRKSKVINPEISSILDVGKMAQLSRLERLYNQSSNEDIDYTPNSSTSFSKKDLLVALEEQQFMFYYQPIVELRTKKTIGFESFLRWQHPDRGLIPTCDFIEDLEASGLIVSLGWWTIDEICNQINIWEYQFPHKPIQISLNLSDQQFFHPNLVERVASSIHKYKITPSNLALEIPEKTISDNPELTAKILFNLKALGLKLQLDKFGINHNSVNNLKYIHKLYSQFDSLKIHQTVIKDLTCNNQLLQAITQIAQIHNIDVIAVGVETSAQSDRLQSLNCKYGQGYFFAKPTH